MTSIKLLKQVNSILMHVVSGFHEEYFSEDLKMLIQFALGIELFNEPETCLSMYRSHTLHHSLFHKCLDCPVSEMLLVGTFL